MFDGVGLGPEPGQIAGTTVKAHKVKKRRSIVNTLKLVAAALAALLCIQLLSLVGPASAVAQEYTYPDDLRQPPEIYW